MIEKGLTPPPDSDPMETGVVPTTRSAVRNPNHVRDLLTFFRVASILMTGVAIGLMVLLYVLDRGKAGFAIGGLILSVAGALFVASRKGVLPNGSGPTS